MFQGFLALISSLLSTPGGPAFAATLLRDAAEVLEAEAMNLDGVDADNPTGTPPPAPAPAPASPAIITIPRP